MLREGMEAILVLVAIMAYLAKSGNKKYLGTVYNYSIAAVAASFITAYIFSVILGKFTGGASREAIEGVTASLLLLFFCPSDFGWAERQKAMNGRNI